MSTQPTAEQIVETVLRWPTQQRLRLLDALHNSLVDPSIDHGPEDPADEVDAAWKEEIGRRIADLDNGKVTTIPADQAKGMIRGDIAPPAN